MDCMKAAVILGFTLSFSAALILRVFPIRVYPMLQFFDIFSYYKMFLILYNFPPI